MNALLAQAPAPQPATDPLWYKDAVIYQLHIKSFFDANDDGIGDFAGLIAKLDYIVSLGVNTLWLLPFYPSPRRDDGYDIAAYEAVHPDYGTLEDARAFIAAAHARDLRVITELVINHTSDQHPWFERARTAPVGSNERNFYVWADDDQGYAGTRIIFCDTEKSNWTYDAVAGQYYWHRFYAHQPDLNFDNPAVLDAVIGVMHFWLDMGVDGLRLDAVPYLIEREGTSNENLPETHAILKRIRAEIDAHFPGRMLLAEANMWPEDTQQYFGDVRDGVGDECHMAFHFPLMPRMYMAIAREDRFPITDILRQTPEIPFNCQWAIFLRNHDELTLEMVTDSERDYLWQTYAADRRARINLGIRRRLAPLLQRDRRRIELMTALLLTLPGTPVLYYGDEIGMGDNIHLGDRDGVRTPMQWSVDRNGGFSRADPAAMVLPPLMDPLYGYATVNVEAQDRDQYSQLNWTRRVLAVRKRHRAFGRGTLEFLYPGNRKIMAYLREFEGDVLLCVANLSRTVQAVELDLSRYETRIPVDIVGGSAFPPIGKLTYLLTLPAYGFYAFQLAQDAQLPAWHLVSPEPLPEYRTLVLREGAAVIDVLHAHRGAIERDILLPYLQKRRWFDGKGRTPLDASLETLGVVDGYVIAAIDVRFEHDTARYQLPLAIVWEGSEGGNLTTQLALARVRFGRRVGYLTDAFATEGFARRLLGRLDPAAASIDGLAFRRSMAFDIGEDVPVHWMSVEQSNSSLAFGDRALLKVIRRIRPGLQPEQEFGRVLTEAGFANGAPLLGEVVARDKNGEETLLALVQGYVRNQGDAWSWALDTLQRAIDDWKVAQTELRRGEISESFSTLAATVGRRLGELHRVLAGVEDDTFAPRVIDRARALAIGAEVAFDVQAAVELLGASATGIDARAAIDALTPSLTGALETRIHGDFHLGQILISGDDVVLVDFEGEPARPLAQRRERASPLRDVAGFLRSLAYAGAVARRTHVDDAVAEACIAHLLDEASVQFIAGYGEVLAASPRPWIDAARLEPALLLFVMQKAAYEVAYEIANRPTWVAIPTDGLRSALARAERWDT